jgi:3'(2'), 5'-bisphosphate nucleotidase
VSRRVTELSDARLAASLAEQAGELLMGLRASSALAGRKLGALGDAEANELLLHGLTAARPGDAVLSEESADSPARLTAPRVWIIDPLDGTREFGMPGRPDWAVHVALWQAGHGITDAAVAQPELGAVYVTDSIVTTRRTGRTPVVLVSDSRPPAFAGAVAAELGGEVRKMGSAGAKAMAVVRGQADAYVHAGGQWEWDSAAPAGVARAAGLHVSRVDGTELLYNQPHPFLPDLVICRPELAEQILRAIAAAG